MRDGEGRRLRLSRREALRRAAALWLAAPGFGGLLAACILGNDDDGGEDADPTATTAGPVEGSPTAMRASVPPPQPTATAAPATGTSEPGATPDPGGSEGVINLMTTQGDTGIGNPILSGAIQTVEHYVFSRLMTVDDRGAVVPELARDWSLSDDQLSLTLNLNAATWHDGEPFTADDVIFTFDAIAAETTATNRRQRLRVAGETLRWEKVDDATVTIISPQPFAPLLFLLSEIPIIPEHLLAGSEDINSDPFNRNPIGTGPYRLEEWTPGERLRLATFEGHFRGRPRNDGLTVQFLSDYEAGAAALEAGEIDMMFAPPYMQARFEGNPELRLHAYVYFTPVTLAFNHRHPLLQNVNVRRAIGMAIDRAALAAAATGGRGTVANHQFADDGPLARYNDDALDPLPYAPQEASALLDAAGLTPGADGVRRTPEGERVTLTLVTYTGFDEYRIGQGFLQAALSEVGIEVMTQVVDYATLERMLANPEDDPLDRALELEEWPRPFEFDPDLYNELHSDSLPPGRNYMWFVDQDTDALIDQGRATTDPDERVEVYRRLDARRAETLPALPLYNAVDAWAVSTRVQGVADSPYFRRYALTSAQDWWKG